MITTYIIADCTENRQVMIHNMLHKTWNNLASSRLLDPDCHHHQPAACFPKLNKFLSYPKEKGPQAEQFYNVSKANCMFISTSF